MTNIEPTAMFANGLPVRLWRERLEPPAVTIRCGRGKGSCDRLAKIFETPDTAVVVFFQNTPDQPALVAPEQLAEEWATTGRADSAKHVDPHAGQALMRGRRDEVGTVVCLERDDYWSNVVKVGCRHHIGLITLSRETLMTYLRSAREDRSGRLQVSLR